MFAFAFTSFDQQDTHSPGGKGWFGGGGDDKDLTEFFKLFELTFQEARKKPQETRVALKKSWKKLSLRHHPDRN
jgi:hypothetical protein